MDGLYNHDGVIHHDGDGKQQCREHEQVDGEAENPEEEERTEKGHRHRNHRDERGAEVLKEDIHHDEDKQQGDEEREQHFLDRCEEELRHVVVQLVCHARREGLCLLLKLSLHVFCNLCGVGAGNLLHHTHDRRLSVVFHRHAVHQSAELHLRHVLQTQRLAVLVAADDDVLVFFGCLQTSLVSHGVFVRHVALLAELARCGLDVLLCQCRADV